MKLISANNVVGLTLASGISASATSLTLSSGQGALLPTPAAGQQLVLTIKDASTGLITEIVYAQTRSGDVLSNITRAQESTAARAWQAGDVVNCLMTNGMYQAALQADDLVPLQNQVDAIEDELTNINAEDVIYDPPFTGGVQTDVESKLAQTISLADFMGVAVSTAAAFTAALTAASGKVLVINPGTYTINSGLTIPANTTVMGYGASLDFSGAGNIAALTLGANVKLYGLKLIGPGNASYNGSSVGIKCYGINNSPLAPTYVQGPTINDVTVTEFAGQGLDFKYCNKGKVTKCTVTECGYTGIQLLSTNRIEIADNYVGQISPGTSGNSYGIAISSNEGTVTEDPVPVFNKIIGNTVEDVTGWTGIDTHGGSDLIVALNQVQNCRIGIKITDRDVNGVRTIAPKNIVVLGNKINDNGLNNGSAIVVNGAFPNPTADYATGITITGNVIDGHGVSNSSSEGAIRCYSTRGLSITGNTIRRPKVVGIVLDFDNESHNVTGNTIIDPIDSVETTRCIYVKGGNNLGSIVGNTFTLENLALATNVAQWGVENGAGVGTTNILTVANNNLVNVRTGHLQMSERFGIYYTNGDTTPSVKNTGLMLIANSDPTTITNFDDAYDGQVITLYFSDSNTTINRSNAYLAGGANFVSTANDTLVLQKLGSVWLEMSRSVNS